MTDAKPLDAAAVSATYGIESFAGAWIPPKDRDRIARIITDAYAEQMTELTEYRRYLEGDDTSTIAKLNARLTAALADAEKLDA